MAGISFLIGDEQLVLSAKQKISISQESPLFSSKTIPGTISFPFDLETNSTNLRLLKLSNTLMNFEANQNVKCSCFLGGNIWKKGFILINGYNRKSINVTFTEFNSEEQFDKFFLRDMDLPTIEKTHAGNWTTDYIKSAINERVDGIFPNDEKDFICPTVYNEQCREVTQQYAIGGYLNQREQDIDEIATILFQNLYESSGFDIYSGVYTNEIKNINLITPFFYLKYILKNLFIKLGYTISYNKLDESDLVDLIVYNSKGFRLTSNGEYSTNPPPVTHPPSTSNLDIRYLKFADFMPDINFTDTLASVKNTFNLYLSFDYENNKVELQCKSDIIKNLKVLDISDTSAPFENYDLNEKIKLPNGIFYAKNEDAILEDFFTLKGYFYKGIISSVSELPTSDNKHFDYYMIAENVTNKDYYPIYYYATNNTWQLLTASEYVNIRPYDVYLQNESTNTEKIELKSDTLVVRPNERQFIVNGDTSDILKYFIYCPAIDTPVINEFHNVYQYGKISVAKNITSFHLLFYRGKLNTGGYIYPYANRNNFLPNIPSYLNGEIVSVTDEFEHSLEIDGPKGLYEKFYKDWILFLRSLNSKATYNVRWSAAQINNSLFFKALQINGNRFIISKLTITADANTIYPCKTEMYQVEPK